MKGAFGLSGILDLAFLFNEEIWHDVKKGSGYILSSIALQTLAVSPANNDLGICDLIFDAIVLEQFYF